MSEKAARKGINCPRHPGRKLLVTHVIPIATGVVRRYCKCSVADCQFRCRIKSMVEPYGGCRNTGKSKKHC